MSNLVMASHGPFALQVGRLRTTGMEVRIGTLSSLDMAATSKPFKKQRNKGMYPRDLSAAEGALVGLLGTPGSHPPPGSCGLRGASASGPLKSGGRPQCPSITGEPVQVPAHSHPSVLHQGPCLESDRTTQPEASASAAPWSLFLSATN